jgi:transmembrane sensor
VAASAVAAAVVAARSPFGLWPSLSDYAADYRTATGERRTVAVAEGVSVDMNTDTSLNLTAAAGGPRIDLVSGEAVITALPSARGPVSVVAGGGRITAFAASVSVRCDGDAVRVTCLDGQVGVVDGDRQVTLDARQQARYLDRHLQAVTRIDPEVVTAWQRGMLIFNGAPLRQVIAEVNRYRPGRIILVKAEVGARLVTARFRLDALDDVIPQVCQVFGVQARSLPGDIVLLT